MRAVSVVNEHQPVGQISTNFHISTSSVNDLLKPMVLHAYSFTVMLLNSDFIARNFQCSLC